MAPVIDDLIRSSGDLRRALDWLPEWAAIALVLAGCVMAAVIVNDLVFDILKRLVRRRELFWRSAVDRARRKGRVALVLIALGIGATISPLDPAPADVMRRVLLFLFILCLGWIAMGIVHVWSVVYSRRYKIDVEDNLLARKHVTQVRILKRVVMLLIVIVTLGLALMTVSGFRQWGISLLASAGAASIVAGLALQPLLTNLMAGIQIALTQPIRIDDAVIVEGEWGNIEEITATYVVVRLWDWRRLVLPLTYFISQPFENWTRETARLIGTAFVYVDYEAPIDRLRSAFEQIVRASPLWDGDVQVLQVTEVTDRVAQVRMLASARSAPKAFDLRCEIREKMLAFMRDQCPEALPRDRLDLNRPRPAA